MKVLVLAPHTDDAEVGCGGSIYKHREQGHDVFHAAFSLCDESLPPQFPVGTLEKECRRAMEVLAIPNDRLWFYNFPVRHFPEHRQDILEILVGLKEDVQPDLVYAPSAADIHQDHQVMASEALRAFKGTCLLGYELPWNTLSFKTMAFNVLDVEQMWKKKIAIGCYKTQARRPYMNEEAVYSLARTRGVQIGAQYAEAFEVVRWIL